MSSPHCPPVLHQLERVRVLGRLGVGGMAEIFLADDAEDPTRRAVIKRMLPNVVDDAELVTMFLDEARLGMRLTHPNLCRFFDAAEVDGQPCIAMEWVNGVTLEQLVERASRLGGVPVPLALSIVADVAAALDSVHRARDASGRPLGVVHRDVTPKNLMIAFDGTVKLLDFGLAKSMMNHAITQPGMAKGKFAYLAPEVWSGRAADPRADLWALGVCLFEAIAGRPLFHYARPFETMAAIVDAPVPSLREHAPSVPAALEDLSRRCLAKDPEARFASAADLQTAIEQLLLQLGGRPGPEALARWLSTMFAEEIAEGPRLEPTDFAPHRTDVASGVPDFRESRPPTVLQPVARRRRRDTDPTQRVHARRGAAGSRRTLGRTLTAGAAAVLVAGLGVWIGSLAAPTALPAISGAPPAPTRSGAGEAETTSDPAPEPVSSVVRLEPIAIARSRSALATATAPRWRPRPAPASFGVLDVNSVPWSEVLVDGQRRGYTPLGDLRVTSGRHRVTFVDPSGAQVERVVDVPVDGAARVFVRFSDPGPTASSEPAPSGPAT